MYHIQKEVFSIKNPKLKVLKKLVEILKLKIKLIK